MIFVMPPEVKTLRHRLKKRNTEDENTIEKRLNIAIDEIKSAEIYDYIIVNDDLDKSVMELKSILISEKCRIKNNLKLIEEVLFKYRPAVTDILKKGESYYSLVVAVAKRAREIAEEAEKRNDPLTGKICSNSG